MKLLSWNVNGARAGLDKGTLLPWMTASGADVVCLQETKCHPGDVAHVSWPGDYGSVTFYAAEKKGYSGTALLAKHAPLAVRFGFGLKDHDAEGRVLTRERAGQPRALRPAPPGCHLGTPAAARHPTASRHRQSPSARQAHWRRRYTAGRRA